MAEILETSSATSTSRGARAKAAPSGSVPILDIIFMTLRHWPWILLSVAVCVGVAYFWLLRTPNVYSRSAEILIKDESKGNSVGADEFANMGLFQSKTNKGRVISAIILCAVAGVLVYIYSGTPDPVAGIQPQQYQQFNPFYVVALTPVSLALFGWLAKKGKEPSAPRKIGFGMLMAGVAYAVLMIGSFSISGTQGTVSPNWLISTYLLLTFAELLLSPMGISFVSKVAPPKYKGSMMGGWFAATAIGNYLVSIPMLLWGNIPVWTLWLILISICAISAIFIFSIMKKLESATSDEPAPAPKADALENVEDDAI